MKKDPHGSAYGEAVPSSTVALLVEGFKEEALVRKLRLVGFKQPKLGGGFKYFLFSPLFGEDSQFD